MGFGVPVLAHDNLGAMLGANGAAAVSSMFYIFVLYMLIQFVTGLTSIFISPNRASEIMPFVLRTALNFVIFSFFFAVPGFGTSEATPVAEPIFVSNNSETRAEDIGTKGVFSLSRLVKAAPVRYIITYRPPEGEYTAIQHDAFGSTPFEVYAQLTANADEPLAWDSASHVAGITFSDQTQTVFLKQSGTESDNHWSNAPAAISSRRFAPCFARPVIFVNNLMFSAGFATGHVLETRSLLSYAADRVKDFVSDFVGSSVESSTQSSYRVLNPTANQIDEIVSTAMASASAPLSQPSLRYQTYQMYPGGVYGRARRIMTLMRSPNSATIAKTADAAALIPGGDAQNSRALGRLDRAAKKYGYDSAKEGIPAEYYLQTHMPMLGKYCTDSTFDVAAASSREMFSVLSPCSSKYSRSAKHLFEVPEISSIRDVDQTLHKANATITRLSTYSKNTVSWAEDPLTFKSIGGAASLVSSTFNIPISKTPACTVAKVGRDLEHLYNDWYSSPSAAAVYQRPCIKLKKNIHAILRAQQDVMNENDNIIERWDAQSSTYAFESSSSYATTLDFGYSDVYALDASAHGASVENLMHRIIGLFKVGIPPVNLQNDIVHVSDKDESESTSVLGAATGVAIAAAGGDLATKEKGSYLINLVQKGKRATSKAWGFIKKAASKTVDAGHRMVNKIPVGRLAGKAVNKIPGLEVVQYIIGLIPLMSVLTVFTQLYFQLTFLTTSSFVTAPLYGAVLLGQGMSSGSSDDGRAGQEIFPIGNLFRVALVNGAGVIGLHSIGPLANNFFTHFIDNLPQLAMGLLGAMSNAFTMGLTNFDTTDNFIAAFQPFGLMMGASMLMTYAARSLFPQHAGQPGGSPISITAGAPNSKPSGNSGRGGDANPSTAKNLEAQLRKKN